jgi:hypothetical protein
LKASQTEEINLLLLSDGLVSQASKFREEITNFLNQTVTLPTELIAQIKDFTGSSKGDFASKEDFVIDAINFRLEWLKSNKECLEISREDYDALSEALKEMRSEFFSVEEFVQGQIANVLQKYDDYLKSKRRKR